MSIQSIDEQGNIQWRCLHRTVEDEIGCQTINTTHISHEAVQWVGLPGAPEEQHLVALPACSGCGARTFLKVHFSEKELMAPNMWQVWNDWHEKRLQELQAMYSQAQEGTPHKIALGEQIIAAMQCKQAGGMHTQSHATAQRHMQFREQLIASGKTVPPALDEVF